MSQWTKNFKMKEKREAIEKGKKIQEKCQIQKKKLKFCSQNQE